MDILLKIERCTKRRMTMFDYGNLQFIWGIKSWDDLSEGEANLFTMNDLDIVYHKDTGRYCLELETIYCFKDPDKGDIEYLENILDRFRMFIKENKYVLPKRLSLSAINFSEPFCATTIQELYLNFEIFVRGYKALYETMNKESGVKHKKNDG